MNLRDELTGIYERHGSLTPAIVVTEAEEPTSPLHHRLEWDNEKAGPLYRLVQARELIRSCRVVYKESPDGEEVSTRAFVATYAGGDAETTGYVPVEEAMGNEVVSAVVLRSFERQVKALRRQYAHLTEFHDIVRRELLGEQEAS